MHTSTFLEALNFLDKSQFFIDMCKYIIKGGFPIFTFFGVTSLLTLLIPFFLGMKKGNIVKGFGMTMWQTIIQQQIQISWEFDFSQKKK